MRNTLLALGGIALLLLVWLQWSNPEAEQAARAQTAAPVTVIAIEPQPFREQISALGTLRSKESVDITASVSQIVTELRFDDGQQVRKGDVLAVLKQDSALAMQKELRASLEDAKREVKRLENLARKNQVAQMELDKARTRSEVIEHQIEDVQSSLSDRTIVAPFDGVLGLREVSEGALVTPGQKLTTLDDLSSMRLDFTVPASRLAFLHIGQPIVATTQAYDKAFSGQVTAIDSRVDPVARAISGRAVLPNKDHLLRPGLLMEVTLSGPERQVLMVPEESLESRALEQYVWKVNGETAVRTSIKIGDRRPGWVEVVEGLQAGDVIVRDGIGSLRGDTAAIARKES